MFYTCDIRPMQSLCDGMERAWANVRGNVIFINPRPSGGLSQLRPSGGGACYHPLLTVKPIGLERRVKAVKNIRQLSIGTFEL